MDLREHRMKGKISGVGKIGSHGGDGSGEPVSTNCMRRGLDPVF